MPNEIRTPGPETALVPREETRLALGLAELRDHLEEEKGRLALMQEFIKGQMQENQDFGTIPGTPKPTLYKSGAEKLCKLYHFDPEYQVEKETFFEDGHLFVRVTCTLYHIDTGRRVASGMGSCTTREEKYAYREASRKCPSCGSEAIMKGKKEYGGGWICWKKKGGCGATFKDVDPLITGQPSGKVTNPRLPDCYNTCLKMACKRAFVAATLNGTAASAYYTQDVEDFAQSPDSEAQPFEEEMPPPDREPGDEPPAPSHPALISMAQVKRLWALAYDAAALRSLGKKDAEAKLRDVLKAKGRESTACILRSEYEAICNELAAWGEGI